MNTKYILVPLLLCITLFTACDENSFQKDIEVDLPDHEPKLAISSHVIVGSDNLRVYVNNSLGVLDNQELEGITDATVQLYINGTLRYDLPHIYDPFSSVFLPEGTYGLDNIDVNELTLGNYELRVSAGGFDPVNAQQTAPNPVPLISAEYIESDIEEVDDQIVYRFLDPSGEKNYYAFEAFLVAETTSGTIFRQKLFLDIGDDLVANFSEIGPILSDEAFDGQTEQIVFDSDAGFFENPDVVNQTVFVILRTITEDKYRFFRSFEIYQNSKDNPFAEPVIIHDNVNDGYGVFSLESRDTIEIVL